MTVLLERIRQLFRSERDDTQAQLRQMRGLRFNEDYQSWIMHWENRDAGLASRPVTVSLSVLLMGESCNADDQYWDDAAARANGRLTVVQASSPTNATGDYAIFLRPADRLSEFVLQRLDAAREDGQSRSLIFGDEDQIDLAGQRFAPWFKPDYGDDLFLSQNGFGRAVFFPRRVFETLAVEERDLDTSVYQLALDTILATDRHPVHCPGVLVHVSGDPTITPQARCVHLPAESRRSAVERFMARRPNLAGSRAAVVEDNNVLRLLHPLPLTLPTVSIVIPTRDRKDLLASCIHSLDKSTAYGNKEIIVIDNDSREPETKAYLDEIASRSDVQVIASPGPFNYSRLINLGASRARGELLMCLNNDIEAFEPDWLSEMVAQALRPDVGVVGCLLLYPDRSIQHAGVVIGLGGVAGHVFGKAPAGASGYAGRIAVAQDLSAVTGACHVMRREVFEELSGLDAPHLAVAYNDIDFCLRVRRAGLRVIYTPYARLLHHHSATRGSDVREDRLPSYMWEREYMRTKWPELTNDDPFFNPNLSLYDKRGRLATPPRLRLFA
jgi:GT2 family glycosyltransferase